MGGGSPRAVFCRAAKAKLVVKHRIGDVLAGVPVHTPPTIQITPPSLRERFGIPLFLALFCQSAEIFPFSPYATQLLLLLGSHSLTWLYIQTMVERPPLSAQVTIILYNHGGIEVVLPGQLQELK